MLTNVSANKIEFADLKYEQLLSEKYFVETCFTKKYESYRSHEQLIDLMLTVKVAEMNINKK